jgi:hypothetical protein
LDTGTTSSERLALTRGNFDEDDARVGADARGGVETTGVVLIRNFR